MPSDALALPADRDTIGLRSLERLGDLEALREEWRLLWQRCPTATPFQSPDWLIPWWQSYGDGRLLCWTMRRAGRLIGMAPLYVCPDGPCRRVLLIGTGNSDYLDILCEADQAATVTRLLFRQLASCRALWDRCDFQQLAPGALLLHAVPPAHWRDEIAAQDACLVLALRRAQGPEAPIWRKARYHRRRAERVGAVAFERAGEDSLDEVFAALLRLHRRRWEKRDLPGVLAEPRDQDFHHTAARALLRRGVLRLYALRLDGRIIAALYGFHAHRRTYFYLAGFDPEFAGLSPGTQIVAHAIEQARQEGAMAFDFMRGREAYKYRWGAVERTNSVRRMWLSAEDRASDGARQI